LQLQIELPGRLAIRQTVAGDVVQFPGPVEFPHLASADAVLRRWHTEDFTEEFQSALLITIEVGKDLANIEVAVGGKPARIEEDVAWNRNTQNGAADIDIRKIERFAIEGHKPLGPDLSDIRPEIGQKLPLFGLAIDAGTIEFHPVQADADDAARAGIQSQAVENLLAFFFSDRIQQDFPGARGNAFEILSNGFDIDDESCRLSHRALPRRNGTLIVGHFGGVVTA